VLLVQMVLVGVTGFEPAAPRSQSECATKLRYTPAHTRSGERDMFRPASVRVSRTVLVTR
jgi:hypothetical protein